MRAGHFLIMRMLILKNTTYSAFSSLDKWQENKQTNKSQRTGMKQGYKSQALFADICLASPFCESLAFTFCFPVYSLFTSTIFASFLNKISDIFPSALYSCMQATFLPCLVFVFQAVYYLFCFSLLPATIYLVYSISYFSSFPVYIFDEIFEM